MGLNDNTLAFMNDNTLASSHIRETRGLHPQHIHSSSWTGDSFHPRMGHCLDNSRRHALPNGGRSCHVLFGSETSC
jgi:hypothetical protein